jgi:hypothetical protein
MSYSDYKKNKQSKSIKVHRIVAAMFVKNNDLINNTIVNHLDGDKLNNHWKNLEWTTASQNVQHAIDNKLIKITKRRVIQYDMDMNEIATFESLKEAGISAKTDDGGIAKACKGTRKTAGGFIWKYADENENEVVLTDEELKEYTQLPDFPNYVINKEGRIYSKAYKKFIKNTACRDGSAQIQVANDTKRKTYLMHNLMAEIFMEKETGKPEIYHLNGNKLDNRLVNLAWTTHSDLCKFRKNLHNKNQTNQTDDVAEFTIDV